MLHLRVNSIHFFSLCLCPFVSPQSFHPSSFPSPLPLSLLFRLYTHVSPSLSFSHTPLIHSLSHSFLFLLVAISCGQLSNPRYGKVVVSGTSSGSTATYSCNSGFKLIGQSVRNCQFNGHWSGSAPHCQRKKLPSFNNV